MKKFKKAFTLLSFILIVYYLFTLFSRQQSLDLSGFSPQGEGVDINTIITLELNVVPDRASLEEHFRIDPEIPGQLVIADALVQFIPDEPLAYQTHYQVTVTDGMRGEQGSLLQETFSFGFDTEKQPPLQIMAVGDIMLDQLTRQRLREYDSSYPFSQIKEILRQGDVVFANLESPVAGKGAPLSGKKYTFRASPFAVKCLLDGGINAVSLANNHIMDYGVEALAETLEILADNNIASAGAGMNKDGAHAAAFLEVQGYKVALLAYTDDFAVPVQHRSFWQAAAAKPGAALLHNEDIIKADIKRARMDADVVLVSFHWGNEYTYKVTAQQKRLAYLAVDAGADLVLGHHPHVPQGVEIYGGTPIVYSLSNFVFYPFPSYPQTQDSFILQAEFQKGSVTALSLIPIRGGDSQPYKPKGKEQQDLLRCLTQLLDEQNTNYVIKEEAIQIILN